MVQIKFKAFGSNSAFGGFAPGDMLRTSEAMAKHLVDLGLAVYVEAKLLPVSAPVEPVVKKARAKK